MGGPTPESSDPWAAPSGQPASPAYQPPPAYGPPPAYPQQPAYWPYVPQPARPRRRWLPWVIVAAVLAVGGCGALIGTVGVRAYHEIDGAKAVANRFLSAVEQGDAAGAQNLLCDEASPNLVQRMITAGIVSHRIVGVGVQSGFGSRRAADQSASVSVNVSDRSGHHRDVLDVVHQHGVWLVCDVFRVG